MLKSFLYSFTITSFLIFTIHNIHQTNKSFDNCEKIIKEIHQAKQKLNYYKF